MSRATAGQPECCRTALRVSRVCSRLHSVVIKMDAGGWMKGRSSETTATTDVPSTAEASEDNEWIKSSISYALSVFRGYIVEKGLEEPNGNPKALAHILKNFYVDIRCKKTGNLFSKNSLSAVRFGLKRYYKRVYGIDIISDAVFTEANRKFRGQMALLREKGLENPDPKRAIAPEDMAKLYRSDVFNTDRPDSLQNKVFFEIMLFFPHRGRYTLKELKKSDFKVSVDSSGRKQLAILKSGQVEGAIFAQGGPSCPVASFEKYLEHLNPRSELFFQRPRRIPFAEQGRATMVWYDDVPIGVNTLCNKMKVISQLAGLATIYTNSSITMSKHRVAVVHPGLTKSLSESTDESQKCVAKVPDNTDVKWSPISEQDMKKLYWSDVFDTRKPGSLQDKVFFDTMLFLYPSGKTLRYLKKTDFAIGQDDGGRKYVYKMSCEEAKAEPPSKRRKYTVGEERMYASGGPECPVASFEKYLMHLNPACQSFFQWPRKDLAPGDVVWYENESVGDNKLRRKMKDISQRAQLSKIYTNHSIILSRHHLKSILVAETSKSSQKDRSPTSDGPTNVIVTGSERTPVKTVTVTRRHGEFGFNVISSAPVIVEQVDEDGPAKEAGIQVGDLIVGVNGETVAQKDHPYVVNLIRSAQSRVTIQLATLQLLKNFAVHTSSSPNAMNLSVDLPSDSMAPLKAEELPSSPDETSSMSPTY